MNTLILVPLGEIYVNPEEIAHISPHATGCYIAFKSNVAALHIPLPVADVIQRLSNHLNHQDHETVSDTLHTA